MLANIKGHVDNMALIIEKLSKARESGSELEKQAVDQMLPLVRSYRIIQRLRSTI
jgi:hypothetical protein